MLDKTMVETIAGTEVVTVAKDAFTYAEPLVVNFDGDQGQFLLRRLSGPTIPPPM